MYRKSQAELIEVITPEDDPSVYTVSRIGALRGSGAVYQLQIATHAAFHQGRSFVWKNVTDDPANQSTVGPADKILRLQVDGLPSGVAIVVGKRDNVL